ncbi:protein of unknown function [Candidatus Nitrosacidococcus tergens]|uniref:Uncharacterized protein n=1 Tax=Candidatus Nitrosacidococcus tergens TaxID=553981 RepID=A0A7G1Q7E2_9GAMM|nr:protein of unknown function [Candidatus Nitrosacidococcus tergens]
MECVSSRHFSICLSGLFVYPLFSESLTIYGYDSFYDISPNIRWYYTVVIIDLALRYLGLP